MVFIVDFFAAQAFLAAVCGRAVGFDGALAVERFGERAREVFEGFDLIAGEQVGMAQPAARQRALQKLHALGLRRKISEGHAAFCRIAEIESTQSRIQKWSR